MIGNDGAACLSVPCVCYSQPTVWWQQMRTMDCMRYTAAARGPSQHEALAEPSWEMACVLETTQGQPTL